MIPSTFRRLLVALVALLVGALLAWSLASRRPAKETAATPPPSVSAPAPASPTRPAATTVTPTSQVNAFRAALDAARTLRNPAQRSLEFGRNLEIWIARDPEGALAYVRQLPAGAEYTQGMMMVLPGIGRADPSRALALAQQMVSAPEHRSIYNELFAHFASADPREAVRLLEQVPAGPNRPHALRSLADSWTRTDPAAALAWARQLDPADREHALSAVLGGLSQTDPLQAMDVAHQEFTGPALERVMRGSLETLTHTDLAAAAAIISKLPPNGVPTSSAIEVARNLAEQKPATALAWMKELPAGNLQDAVRDVIVEVWARTDPGAAGAFVAQMGPGPAQERAAARLALQLGANPTQAIAWAQSLTSEPSRQAAVINLASAWAQRDPAAAAQWAGSLAPGEVRTRALNGAMSYWLLRDSVAARNHVFGLTGETLVNAAAHLAPGLAQQDPQAAIAWAQTLPSADAREAAVIAAYARWLNNDPAAAREWLATANLPPATKAQLAGP